MIIRENFLRMMRSSYILLDIGAMGGIEERWKKLGNHLKVIGFEANKTTCLKNNKSKNMIFINKAIYKRNGSAILNITKNDGSLSSLLNPNKNLINQFPEPDRFKIIKNL
ncbi:MAG: hypothetical protein ACTSVV_11715 [Promethearchaeota archaeon]